MKYLIVIEKTNTGYSAYSPDIPGCVAIGNTLKETENNMREAIQFHFDGLREERVEMPVPHTQSRYLQVA